MSTVSHAFTDSATMLRRNLRHALRYPGLSLSIVGMPVIFLLLFVYVLGGALGAGLGGGDYVDYVAPGIILMTAASATVSTAVSVSMDMTEGIVARFRTMAIARTSLLTGHVIGSMIQAMLSVVLVLGVALLIGFRPTTDPLRWIGAFAVIALMIFALTWLSVALGLVSSNPEGASNITLPLVFLPFIGSAFVPTDSMATGIRWFAEYQPFTPITETIRGLLMGTEIGNSAILAVVWSVVLSLIGYSWARALFNRDPSR
jgi:ABC-2 type transport system permease protein